jgi:hypothetical protein
VSAFSADQVIEDHRQDQVGGDGKQERDARPHTNPDKPQYYGTDEPKPRANQQDRNYHPCRNHGDETLASKPCLHCRERQLLMRKGTQLLPQ